MKSKYVFMESTLLRKKHIERVFYKDHIKNIHTNVIYYYSNNVNVSFLPHSDGNFLLLGLWIGGLTVSVGAHWASSDFLSRQGQAQILTSNFRLPITCPL